MDYTLDLNAGLTQVLDDGTSKYYYGLDRIAQKQAGQYDYFLGDALGSVRQLTDPNGAVTLAEGYDPYGSNVGSVGSGSTTYAFAGEMADATGLIYLRARYYTGDTRRFLSRDPRDGDTHQPISLNRWAYAEANPINRTDPSGYCATDPHTPADPTDCRNVTSCFADQLSQRYASIQNFEDFLSAVSPGDTADWRARLLKAFDSQPIILCWDNAACDFFDGSTLGNVAYGLLGAEISIPRAILHGVASVGQLNDEAKWLVNVRLLRLRGLPPPHSQCDPLLISNLPTYGFDTPGDLNAIDMGYDMYRPSHLPSPDDLATALKEKHSLLEVGTSTLDYDSTPDETFSAPGCGNRRK